MPVLLLSSNSCCVMQCSCIGITWQLCLLSKLNIMTPVLSVVSSHHSLVSSSWFAPKKLYIQLSITSRKNCRMVYRITSYVLAGVVISGCRDSCSYLFFHYYLSLYLSGSCGFTGGWLEGSLPHGLLLQSEPGAMGAQPPWQPTCAAYSQTGEQGWEIKEWVAEERERRETGGRMGEWIHTVFSMGFKTFITTLTPSGVMIAEHPRGCLS